MFGLNCFPVIFLLPVFSSKKKYHATSSCMNEGIIIIFGNATLFPLHFTEFAADFEFSSASLLTTHYALAFI
jgi:hypothetical protein